MVLATGLGAAPSTLAASGDGDERFYGQGIRWGDCHEGRRGVPDGMRCGEITVPLDYADPAKGTVKLALGRIPATGPGKRLGSVFLNYGGPGGPGIESLAADPKPFAELGKRYDLVTFDPRGVGRSEPVSCGGSLEPDPEAGTDAASQLAALRSLVRRCELHSGPVLPYIGTVNVARDLDVMRQVLGDEKLNYLGFSYGTRLGAVYAAQFPGKTGRMVLDGVDTLTEPLAEQALISARGQQRALDNFLAWCAHQPGCVYGTNTRTAKEKVNALVARLDEQPLVDGGWYVTGQDVVAAVATALYSPGLWPALADGLRRIERDGDPSALTELAAEPVEPGDEDGGDDPDRVPADNADAALTAVNCADDPDRGEDKATAAAIEKEIRGLSEEFRKASKIFGPAQLMTVLSCYGRPAGTDFIRRIDRPAGVPRMLLVGTRGDPATPYEWTEETARRLGGAAVVLDHKGEGHTGYATSPCVRDFVHHFLVDGRLPGGTRSCPAGE
ncbi:MULTISPECIES: alpha/beta hydrolase [unclassified Streptomyces]|uniref:alpha/beta hydrolase n=1 Tax=unclassified Streptomyces TaxID=2593676 RepID=UPI00224EB612|nr:MULTISPECIES: alpha/beta hydrolase [unclassified Streptomyces]MCX4527423.1 alpha/beta hydrolase [Streptomyces sp. NBC_01551]MCX4541996.1 alpha/beta hydrolase [Streptomyces sp. NBC_01565]